MGFPLSPAVVAGPAAVHLLSTMAALAVALAGATAWLATRRRWPRAARGVLLASLALVAGAFLPPPDEDAAPRVRGILTGEARVPVRADEGAPLVVEGGEGRLERGPDGTVLVLGCPQRCSWRLGAEPAYGAGPGASLPSLDALEVDLRGGPFQAWTEEHRCVRLPLTLRAFGGGCVVCSGAEFLAGRGHGGVVRLQGQRAPAC